MLGALANGRDTSVPVFCWCQPHGKPGTGLTSLGEMRCLVVPSKCAPGSAPCGGWLCCWYQVPLISVMSGMYYARDFSSSVSQAQACQEQRPHTLPALPHAALRHPAGCPPVLGWSSLGAPGASLLQSRDMVSLSSKGSWGPGTGSGLQGARPGDAGCHGALRWMFGESWVQGWSAGMWSCQQPLLPVPVREPPVLWSRTQHSTSGCWSL